MLVDSIFCGDPSLHCTNSRSRAKNLIGLLPSFQALKSKFGNTALLMSVQQLLLWKTFAAKRCRRKRANC